MSKLLLVMTRSCFSRDVKCQTGCRMTSVVALLISNHRRKKEKKNKKTNNKKLIGFCCFYSSPTTAACRIIKQFITDYVLRVHLHLLLI
jgi:hypothetical protein